MVSFSDVGYDPTQDIVRARDIILTLARLFSKKSTVARHLESLRYLEHLSTYAPDYVELNRVCGQVIGG